MRIEHKILFSQIDKTEHKAVIDECHRVVGLGGTFEIVNKYTDGNWFTFITISYPQGTWLMQPKGENNGL